MKDAVIVLLLVLVVALVGMVGFLLGSGRERDVAISPQRPPVGISGVVLPGSFPGDIYAGSPECEELRSTPLIALNGSGEELGRTTLDAPYATSCSLSFEIEVPESGVYRFLLGDRAVDRIEGGILTHEALSGRRFEVSLEPSVQVPYHRKYISPGMTNEARRLARSLPRPVDSASCAIGLSYDPEFGLCYSYQYDLIDKEATVLCWAIPDDYRSSCWAWSAPGQPLGTWCEGPSRASETCPPNVDREQLPDPSGCPPIETEGGLVPGSRIGGQCIYGE
jgi:hypothetical protein